MTIQELRAQVEAAKKVAQARFAKDWGTSDVRVVADALRKSIPTSTSPTNAARKARALIRS